MFIQSSIFEIQHQIQKSLTQKSNSTLCILLPLLQLAVLQIIRLFKISMEWQFRKTLESFESYKKTTYFKNQIQKGDINTLNMVIRQIELILSEPKEKIIAKVLAMRFVRDVMIMGREDVVEAVQKLIPVILKICSYELESEDPNRGETFFHQHPSYLGTSDEAKRNEIDQLGSTLLILSLESILHWGKWIPIDHSGQQSIYAKAYNQLLERGVVFPATFHYYKISDAQRFKNTYKVQFFTDSYCSSMGSNTLNNESLSRSGMSRNSQSLQQSAQIQIFEKTSITTIIQIKKILQELLKSKENFKTINKKIEMINKRLQHIYENQFQQVKLYRNKSLKQDKNWVQKFFVNFSFYTNGKIDLRQFLTKVNTQEVELDNLQEESLSILNNSSKQQKLDSNVKMYKSPKKEILKTGPSAEQMLRKQQYEYRIKTLDLKSQLQEKQKQIQNVKKINERQKKQLIEDYQRRMEFLKLDLGLKGEKERPLMLQLQFQNEQLKKKVQIIQTELMNTHTIRQNDLEQEISSLKAQITRLRIQNQKLILIINDKNQRQYQQKIEAQSLQNFTNSNYHNLNDTQSKRQNISTKGQLKEQVQELEGKIQQKQKKIKMTQKTLKKLQEELNIYKAELANQRNKQDSKVAVYVKKVQYYESQNKTLKDKLHEARRIIDVKDVQIIDLKEDIRRYQTKLKQVNEKKSQWSQTPTQRSQYKFGSFRQTSSKRDPYDQLLSNRKIKYNNYEDLYSELKPVSKESFLRLCRASFKKKQVLFKENQLEIGVITESLTGDRLNFLLHFTNVSEKPIENVKIDPLMSEGSFVTSLEYEMDLKCITCIQPQQQQKMSVIVTNMEPPFIKDRAIITIKYQKNGLQFVHNVFLPFTIPKFWTSSYPSKPPINSKYLRQDLNLKYTKKMIPRGSYLKSYFQNIKEVIQNKKYQVELYHRQTDINIYVIFNLYENETLNIETIVMRERLNQKQQYIFEEILGFMEVAFRK